MNEDEALELFAPARERVMPPAAFSMTEVYAADARIRRRRRTAAVSATVAAVVVIVTVLAVSGAGSSRTSRPTSSPAAISPARPPTLAQVLNTFPVPTGSVRATSAPVQDLTTAISVAGPNKATETAFWTSRLSRDATVAWLGQHLPSDWSGSLDTSSGEVRAGLFNGPRNPNSYGPNLVISVAPRGVGAAIRVDAWEIPLPAKSPLETLRGVTVVTVVSKTLSGGSGPTQSTVTLTGAQAEQLGSDINDLPVDPGLGGSCTQGAPELTLTFTTSAGPRVFSVDQDCRTVSLVEPAAGAPGLTPSPALGRDLNATPTTPSNNVPSAPPGATQPAPGPANLVSLLDAIPVPAAAQQVSAPADGEPADGGYSSQPGYAQAVRYWTTTMSPAAAIAAMTVRPPAGMTGAVTPPMPNKGHPDAQAHYKVADTAGRIGPRLELYAIELGDGRTAVSALAWQVDESAKPAADLVAGTVVSAIGSYSDGRGTPQADTISGDKARRLAQDFNALLVNAPQVVPVCSPSAATLTLTFHTAAGDKTVTDTCGYVSVLPANGTAPELQTSNAFNLDVNQDFAALMPTPLPSSAPLPVGKPAGTLSIGITVSGGPPGTPNQDLVAGTITVSAGGTRVGGGAVASGARLLVSVTPDRYYDVSATWNGMTCQTPGNAAIPGRQVDVSVVCNIK